MSARGVSSGSGPPEPERELPPDRRPARPARAIGHCATNWRPPSGGVAWLRDQRGRRRGSPPATPSSRPGAACRRRGRPRPPPHAHRPARRRLRSGRPRTGPPSKGRYAPCAPAPRTHPTEAGMTPIRSPVPTLPGSPHSARGIGRAPIDAPPPTRRRSLRRGRTARPHRSGRPARPRRRRVPGRGEAAVPSATSRPERRSSCQRRGGRARFGQGPLAAAAHRPHLVLDGLARAAAITGAARDTSTSPTDAALAAGARAHWTPTRRAADRRGRGPRTPTSPARRPRSSARSTAARPCPPPSRPALRAGRRRRADPRRQRRDARPIALIAARPDPAAAARPLVTAVRRATVRAAAHRGPRTAPRCASSPTRRAPRTAAGGAPGRAVRRADRARPLTSARPRHPGRRRAALGCGAIRFLAADECPVRPAADAVALPRGRERPPVRRLRVRHRVDPRRRSGRPRRGHAGPDARLRMLR